MYNQANNNNNQSQMKHQLISAACGAALLGAVSVACTDNAHKNPFLEPYTTPYEIPPFDQITYADYLPALEAGIAQHQSQIDSIVANPETPTFENTILALDRSGEILDKVVAVFANLDESNSSPEMVEIAEKFYPMLSQHSDETSMNDKLFERVKYLYDHPELGYANDQRRMIEDSYKSFTRNGALLDAEKKEELKKINSEITDLYLQFNKNLLNATNSVAIVVEDSARLAGLPASSIAVAAEEAAKRNLGEGKWVFTLH
ncbi:MAG: peptidase M3, partial [Muribaculaceae bacterium]|nr:peptidase M3 [Muribaculaceae bacterium]